MVKHVVLWDLNEALAEEKREVVCGNIKESLEGLVGKIPGLVDVKVSYQMVGGNADIILDSTLESLEALEVYYKHPDHVKVGAEVVRPNVQNRRCADYEMDCV